MHGNQQRNTFYLKPKCKFGAELRWKEMPSLCSYEATLCFLFNLFSRVKKKFQQSAWSLRSCNQQLPEETIKAWYYSCDLSQVVGKTKPESATEPCQVVEFLDYGITQISPFPSKRLCPLLILWGRLEFRQEEVQS